MIALKIQDAISENLLDEKKFHLVKTNLVSSGGMSYYDFKKKLRPNYTKIAVDITAGWLLLIVCVIAGIFITQIYNPWLKISVAIADAVVLGFIVNYLSNFFHEAAHYNIAPDKKMNDLLANCFLGILQAQNIQHYRLIHWQHHIHIGTPEDTERSYFDALNIRFFFESLTGIRAIRIFLFRSGNTLAVPDKDEITAVKKQQLLMLIAGTLFHIGVLSALIISKQYWAAGIWLIGFGTFFPFFGALRQLLEHRSEEANKKIDYNKSIHGRTNRIFSGSIFAAAFGSAGFDRHLLHHLEPQISYTNLKQLENFLSDTSVAAQLKKHKISYLIAFIKLFGK